MRGKAFHNQIAEEVKTVFNGHGWQVSTEHRYRKNGITTFFDLFAVKGNKRIACEVETTIRHAVDNALKAQATGVALWIIVPTRALRRQIEHKLGYLELNTGLKSIRIILFCHTEAELKSFNKTNF